MKTVLKHNQMLTKSGVFVVPKTARKIYGDILRPSTPVQVYFNGVFLGEKILDGDYRVRIGKPLVAILTERSVVSLEIDADIINITVTEE